MNLRGILAREQRAFLGRNREAWGDHLSRVRAFLGAGLAGADPDRPTLILGAGTGLEVPWDQAPRFTIGWDGDPWSRLGTALRHRRWPSWVFKDVTGGVEDLLRTAQRCVREGRTGRRRDSARARTRLAGLLPSLVPGASPLREWMAAHHPGTILAANLLGQLGCLAQRTIEAAFAPNSPWEPDPEREDPLAEALDAWTARAVRALLRGLAESGAELWMVHDRGVVFGMEPLQLGPLREPWTSQLESAGVLEVADPLAGVEVRDECPAHRVDRLDRWIWPVAPGQIHIMEALALRPTAG